MKIISYLFCKLSSESLQSEFLPLTHLSFVTFISLTAHHYYGQYKCRCQADDDIASVLESPKTELPATEFDQDLVFQRNYSAKINDQVIEAKMGFLELPEDPQNSYFELHVAAHSLTKKLDLNVTIMEGDSYAAHLKEYTNPTMVMAFPRADEAAYAWPIPAYRVAASEMYPDLVDEGPVSIEWSTSEEAASVRTIKEHLRIIILSSSRDGTVRAWEWQRDAHHLDMRAYYQVGESEATSVKLYLQRSGCTPDAHPERLGSVELVHDNCIVDNTEPIKPECLRTGSGFVVRFVVPNPSASDAFDLYQVSSNDSPDKQLVHSTAMQQNLQNDLLATDISLKIVGLADGQKPDETQMDVAVIVHSKVIVDNSACLPMTIALHPTWPVGEKLESHLIANETRFTMPVPNDQRVLTLDLEMRIEAVNDSHPELTNRRSLTLPNPRYYGLEVTVNEATGEVKWPAVSLPFRDLLDRFEVKVTSVNRVCGVTEELDAPDIKQEFNGSPVYVLNLGELPDFGSNVMREYNFVITPLFKSSAGEPVKGAKTEGTLNKGQLEHTAIKSHLPVSSRSVRILVVPSQSAACLRGNPALTAEFNIQVIGEGPEKPDYLAEVEFEPDTTDASAQGFGRWYTLKGLQPGRRYEVQATVHYPTETKDEPSAFYQFWTPDEVSISTKAVYVSSGASAILNCTGVVGPSGPYQKRLEWKRQDGTPLPEGNRVETVITADKDTDWTETISLIFDNVEPGQANIYGCFIRPSVMEVLNMPVSPPTARLVVSELELNMQSHEAKSGESVSVECHTQQKGKLSWTLPDGQEVTTSEAGSNPYVEETASPRGGTNLILHIPNAKLAHTGEYVCTHPDSSSHRLFHLLLVEDIRLQIGAGSSQKAGEQLLLNCSASLGDAKRKIEWYRRGSSTEVWTLLRDPMKGDPSISITNQPSVPTDEENLHTSLLKTVNSPGSDGEFACALNSRSTNVEADEEMVFTTSTLPKVHAQLNVASTPVVKIGRIKQTIAVYRLSCS
ncbi:Immunoglobulin domain protein [Paragonimus skrjabini miyazakii]|uniref:Immunoglobulin domain protein n=1 Tax=Paragonimus skrjabini miyazakii TaxID=59628 RepID=A0A8S9Z8V9_9TREM|nr:Immunoglobulin domain protein [Paragonimus skrjabini miyazakii]